ncbi:branched-chain amino acid ABC transporter substrate-binding protein [Rugosimonospora acidiphila]|uniref:Branched-chain amino acid ABC transporter substrate-binding protein n=1 Tax=Rugosimonospora acidiphila TaxID=556531 RepID=A0ABP9RKL8_9ACTN
MRRTATSAVVALLVLSPLVGCGDRADAFGTTAVGRCNAQIAVFGPLTGASANLGRNLEDGARLAVDQYDAVHPDCRVGMVDFDSQGDPKQAAGLAQQLVAQPRILGVVGPAFSGEADAAVPLLNQGRVTSITPSATETSLSAHGWSTFHRLIGSEAVQGPAAGRYLATVLKARKVFVIDDGSEYGHGLATEVMNVLGERVVESGTVLAGQDDFATIVSHIKAAGPDAIFFGGYYDEAGLLLRQVRAAGVTATFVAGDGVKDDGFLTRAGLNAAQNAIITCPCRPPETLPATFTWAYRAAFGGLEPGTDSAEAYDAATVLLRGIGSRHLSRTSLAAYVRSYDQPGITTTIRFTATGELVGSSVTVWTYRVRGDAIVADRPIP